MKLLFCLILSDSTLVTTTIAFCWWYGDLPQNSKWVKYPDSDELFAWRDIPQPVATPELKLEEWFFERDIKGFQTAPTLKVLYFNRPSKAITKQQYEYGATKLGFTVKN